jgi:hypothetical protein
MNLSVDIDINGSAGKTWQVISNIENATDNISGIEEIEILEKPQNGLVGLKWRETRTLFGKTATEVMWITDAVENEYYKTRAESHGSVYVSKLMISETNGQTRLTMDFGAKAQTFVAKILYVLMGFLFNGATIKALKKDLDDIKIAVEKVKNR